MRRALGAIGLALWALPALAEPLDPARWPDADRRFLQAALAWSGDYVGLTGGDWGARSEAALSGWLGRERAALGRAGETVEDLHPLAMALVDEVWANGWVVMNLDSAGLSVALPAALLGPVIEVEGGLEARSVSDDLVFRILFDGPGVTLEMHRWMADAHAGAEEPYRRVRGGRMVSAVTLANGKRVYLRSALVDGLYVSMQVVAEPWQRARLELIASSMQWGWAPDLWPVPGGPLDRMLIGPADPPPLPASPESAAMGPAPDAAPPSGPPPTNPGRPSPAKDGVAGPAEALGAPLATGTGFFVNGTDLVTAAHVVEGCSELRLEDGSTLAVIASDPVLDLAVLASGRRSEAWLPIRENGGPRLGQPVFALGFPYVGLGLVANQGLSVTGGNVSALPRVTDAASRVMVTAPVQPGNSGGPLLGAGGEVLGVVVAVANSDVVYEETGTLPQNMNFVTAADQLARFLGASRVLFPAAATVPAQDLSHGIPDEVQAAVVLISCFGAPPP